MTPQSSINYDTLPAGRELDALVAERVMGWLDVGKQRDSVHTEFVNFGVDPATVEERRAKKYAARQVVPHYSSDIAAAFQVVEKMAEKGDLIFLQTHRGDAERYAATFVEPFTAYAPTAPLAICRAALKAVSV